MVQWEQLTWLQKAAFWCVIGFVGWFSPEIALLFHFGGIEVVFAFLAFYFEPIIRRILAYYEACKRNIVFAYFTFRSSACATPKVFFVQATFCSLAWILFGSIAFSAAFFMPSLLFNGALI